MAIGTYISIITLNVNGLNAPTRRHRLAAAAAKSLQSCPTLCDPMDCSLPNSSVYGIFQVRILEWVAISSFQGSSWPRDRICISYGSCIGRQILYRLSHLRKLTWERLMGKSNTSLITHIYGSCFCIHSASLSEKAMATHSSILTWKIPWAEEPGRVQSMELQRVGHDWATELNWWDQMHDLSFLNVEL